MNKVVSQLAHDLKNPVSNGLMYSDMLEQMLSDLDGDDQNNDVSQALEFSKHIRLSLQNMYDIIEAWSVAHEIAHNEYKYEPGKLYLPELIERALERMHPFWARKDLNIIKDWDDGLYCISDEKLIPRVIEIMTLLMITYAEPQASFRFSLKKQDGSIQVSLEDSYPKPREDVQQRFTGEEPWQDNEVLGSAGILKPAAYGVKYCGMALNFLEAEPEVTSSDLGGLAFRFRLPAANE